MTSQLKRWWEDGTLSRVLLTLIDIIKKYKYYGVFILVGNVSLSWLFFLLELEVGVVLAPFELTFTSGDSFVNVVNSLEPTFHVFIVLVKEALKKILI
jgi:hypothetical protein